MSDGPLQLHPDVQRLLDANALLRDEIVRLLAERDELAQVVKPNLLAIYQTKLGPWELRLLKAQFAVARLKRKTEMIQASLNSARRPNLVEIEAHLEEECITWKARVEEAAKRIEDADARLKHLLAPTDARELKALYRRLARQLHPDVNRDLTDDHRRLWQRVQAAHLIADLDELRALALLAERLGPVPPAPSSVEVLGKEQKTLQTQIDALRKQIEQTQTQPPHSMRQQLLDDAWLESRRGELEAQIAQLESHRAALEAHVRQLIPDDDHGRWLSQN